MGKADRGKEGKCSMMPKGNTFPTNLVNIGNS